MKTITIAATKGGVGKTTITSGLAVEIAKSHAVALIDTDPQKSLETWFSLRDDTQNMALLTNVTDITQAQAMLEQQQADYLLIDTPPSNIASLELAIEAADFVLIPTKAGLFDVIGIDPVLELCSQHRKKHAIVINMVDGKEGKTNERIAGTAKYLADNNGNVLEDVIMNRDAYPTASFSGQSAPEIEANGKSAEEIASLWLSIKKLSRGML